MFQLTRRLVIALLMSLAAVCAHAQELRFPANAATDDVELAKAMPLLARQALELYRDDNRSNFLSNRFRLQLAAEQFTDAAVSLDAWRGQYVPGPTNEPPFRSTAIQLYTRTRALEETGNLAFEDAFRKVFRDTFAAFDDRTAADTGYLLQTPPFVYQRQLRALRERHKDRSSLALAEALELVRAYVAYEASRDCAPLMDPLVAEDDARRYIVDDDVLIHTRQGATLSAILVRSRKTESRLPAALNTVVETNFALQYYNAKYAAARGYAGVSSDAHGKRLSPDEIVLFEKDAEDLYGVIDWISRQPWSDGRVGMYGGSNAGFMTWAAAKSHHPALKTIVPYAPLDPGFGLPMYNNVFITANFDVALYLTNTKTVDRNFGYPARYATALENWYRSGRPYREIDQVDGFPNKWLQKWLQHPAYDAYWQSLTANGKDYDKLDIPILAIDGYYDDGQNNAVRRLQEHYRHRANAEHYLVIGPYDHSDTQSGGKSHVLRGYTIDPVASFDTPDLTYQWFDYVLKRGPKPALLKDRINYQVMGANEWRSAPSIEAMSREKLTLYLSNARDGAFYRLSPSASPLLTSVKMTVDFRDRTLTSALTYPASIVTRDLKLSKGVAFISAPFDAPVSVNGLFSARLRAILNKKDLDIAMVLYEVMPTGEYFHLSYTLQRASFAKNMSRRQLLSPGSVETIPLDNTLLVSRQLGKGSRLLVVLDVNRGPDAQVNYGTGKDVSDESIADAAEPLVVEWLSDSSVTIPISR